jgi:hypothetical protein
MRRENEVVGYCPKWGVVSDQVTKAIRKLRAGNVWWTGRRYLMSNTQAFLLGMMAAWTPSLIILAWFLRRSVVDEHPTADEHPIVDEHPMLDEQPLTKQV